MQHLTRRPRGTTALAFLLLAPLVALGLVSPAAATPPPTPGTGATLITDPTSVSIGNGTQRIDGS
jgi:hypothetical protein